LYVEELRERVYLDQLNLFTTYPFSTTKRLEFSGGVTLYNYDTELTRQALLPSGFITEPRTVNAPSPPGLNLYQASIAVVGDGSFYGFTSPVQGYRYRVEVEPTIGSLNYVTLLLDYRKYFRMKPVTVALRGMHLGRYGGDSEDPRLTDLYLGYPTLVRGYASYSFDPFVECTAGYNQDCFEFDRLRGSRMAVANLEIRFPFLGTSQLGLINFPYLPMELVGFVDSGVAWDSHHNPHFKFDSNRADLGTDERFPVYSTGGAARVNLLGAIILEGYVAFPFQRPNKSAVWGVQIASGW
jgi:hypothetical protein